MIRRALAIALLLAAVRTARADDEIVKGAVVAIEHQEIYVNLGTAQGVEHDAAIRIKRVIHLHHPVTRAPIDEWIPIGSGNITEPGSKLSRVVLGTLTTQIKVGDVVEVLVVRADQPAAPPNPTNPTQPPPPPPPATPVDPETQAVLVAFAQQANSSIPARIAGWERFLSTHAQSPYAAAIRADLDTLAGLRDQLDARTAAPDGTEAVTIAAVDAAPATAAPHAAIPVVVVLERPARVASAYLHYRTGTARAYRRVLMTREHDIYLRAAIPADVVVAPGVDFFVEASLPDGSSARAIATAEVPKHVAVAEPTLLDKFAPRTGQSSVKLAVDYLDFATFDSRTGDHRDHLAAATADFTYLIDSTLEAIGVGFGALSGIGGSSSAAWSATNPIPIAGYRYGYVDTEFGTDAGGVHLGFAGRLIAGVDRDGFGLGGEGRVRIGRRTAANLQIVGRVIDRIGYLADIRFGAVPHENLLLGLSVGATNQPDNGDVAAKLGVELEWIGYQHVSFIVRGSWQGREVAHAGVGGGAGLGFYW